MAQTILCDLCREEEAESMYSTFADGSTVAIGPMCAGLFVTGLAIALGIIPDPSEVPAEVPAPRAKRSRKPAPPDGQDATQPAESDVGALSDAG